MCISTHIHSCPLSRPHEQVETVAETYEQLYVAVEKFAHFILNIILIIGIVPIATPVILILIPLMLTFHYFRSGRMRDLLMLRLKCQVACMQRAHVYRIVRCRSGVGLKNSSVPTHALSLLHFQRHVMFSCHVPNVSMTH